MQNYSYSILIADDSEDYRILLKHYLEALPCVVDEARDGEEAVELFSRKNYDIVLMDIIMPLMDGVDAIAAIRDIEIKRNDEPTPVLSLSAENTVETGVDCIKAGVDKMLIKPVSRRGLVKAICELLKVDISSIPTKK